MNMIHFKTYLGSVVDLMNFCVDSDRLKKKFKDLNITELEIVLRFCPPVLSLTP